MTAPAILSAAASHATVGVGTTPSVRTSTPSDAKPATSAPSSSGPERRVSRPTGGRGGYGLIGLRERVETVGGSLAAGPADDGGWWVIAHFPVAPTAVPSGAEETAGPGQVSRRPSGRHAKPNAHAEPEPDMSWDAS